MPTRFSGSTALNTTSSSIFSLLRTARSLPTASEAALDERRQQIGGLHQLVEEGGAALLQRFLDRLGLRAVVLARFARRLPDVGVLAEQERDRRATQRCTAAWRKASPRDPAGKAELVELLGPIVANAGRQHIVLPAGGGKLETLELLNHRREAFHALHLIFAGDVLPVEEETQELGRADRLDLGSQLVERVAMDAGEQPPVAPLQRHGAGSEPAAQDATLRFEREQHHVFGFCHRAQHLEPAGEELHRVVVGALEREPRLAAHHGPFSQGLK